MKEHMSKKKLAILVIVLVLLIDQTLKIWIKTNFKIGDEIRLIGNWFILYFIENNGMAYGFELAGEYGKIALSLFRIVAVSAIGWYLFREIKKGIPTGLAVSISLILAGAIGNIIDSAFYGLIFTDSYGRVAEFVPNGGGYATFLHGAVVDMLYFPIIKTTWPSWSPINAGDSFVFFRPVFNIADSAITLGIGMILVFYRSFFNDSQKIVEDKNPVEKE
jgi:signal peptidase II